MKNDKLKNITTSDRPSNWMDLPEYKQENRKWLDRSLDISLRVLDVLDEKDMTQTELAQLMNVSRQYVSRILRGSANLTLETISKLEEVLGINLIKVVDEELHETARVDKPTPTVANQQKTTIAIDEYSSVETDERGWRHNQIKFLALHDRVFKLSKPTTKVSRTSSVTRLTQATTANFFETIINHTIKCEASYHSYAKVRRENCVRSRDFNYDAILPMQTEKWYFGRDFVALTNGQPTFGLVIPHLSKENRKTSHYESKQVFNG